VGDKYRAFRDDDDALMQGIVAGITARLDAIEQRLEELKVEYGIKESSVARRSETPTE
jgi:hypothetical protein